MEFYYIVLYCVLFTAAAVLNSVNAISDHANNSLVLHAQNQNCKCENGRCFMDKEGNAKCACKPGFALQEEFTCKPCDCGSLGKCIFVLKPIAGDQFQYQKKCICDVGSAVKDGVCVDCFCGENSACDFDYGERRCYCIEGYSEKDGVCTRCDCGFYGKCEFENGNKKCLCDDGYLELNGICKACDCGDYGTCSFENGQKTCKCQQGYSVNNEKCEPCDCGSNSDYCRFVNGVKQCKCKDRFAERYGTCERCDCGSYGKCNYLNGNKNCQCDDGYLVLNGICEACDCGDYGSCSFENGQKTCKCHRGFNVNNGKCEPCDCGSNSEYCGFVNGVKQCKCKDRYADRYGTCEGCDCGFYGKCNYQNGIKICQCVRGYLELNGICEACDCGDYGVCTFVNGQKTCKCLRGFNVNNGKCEQCDCGSNSDYCGFVNGVKQCKCKARYADRYGTCEECNCGAYSTSCNFNNNQKTCSCLEGYVQKGESCQPGCSTKHPCQNGGYCKDGFCFCRKGTRGEFCEVIDECSTLCPNTKDISCSYDVSSQQAYCKCVDSRLRYNPITRQCKSTCQTDNQCVNGVCRNGDCVCLPGTWGDRCENVDCVKGAITCMNQIYLLWKGSDTLFVLRKRERILMKFVRENVILPHVSDCQSGSAVKCNHHYDILWCHAGNTIYVPTPQNKVLRYRRVDSTGATCSRNMLPRM